MLTADVVSLAPEGAITERPVVASEARILLDLRSPSMEVIDSAAAKLRTTIAELSGL